MRSSRLYGLGIRLMRWAGLDKGKKFNARKETAQGEEYYGIKIFRFYIASPLARSSPNAKLMCDVCSEEMYALFFGDHVQDGSQERGLYV